MTFRAIRIPALVLAALSVACGHAPAEIGRFVADNGYTDPKPPSNLLEPGTIVYRKSLKPLVYGIACTPQSAFGAGIAQALKNADSANASLVSKMSAKFKLDAGYQEQLRASVGGQYLKDVSLDLSDVHVLSLPADVVFDRVSNRTPGCTKAIEFFSKNNQPVSLIVEVLKANALYTVAFSSGFSGGASAQVDAVKGLAVQLGADASTATQSTVKGTGLFWGVRDDASLATVKADDKAGAKGVASVRLIPPESITIDRSPPPEL